MRGSGNAARAEDIHAAATPRIAPGSVGIASHRNLPRRKNTARGYSGFGTDRGYTLSSCRVIESSKRQAIPLALSLSEEF
jgi:hypothetical protein